MKKKVKIKTPSKKIKKPVPKKDKRKKRKRGDPGLMHPAFCGGLCDRSDGSGPWSH